jgi:hypothetical protein
LQGAVDGRVKPGHDGKANYLACRGKGTTLKNRVDVVITGLDPVIHDG